MLRNHRSKFNARIQSLQELSGSFLARLKKEALSRKLTEGKAARLARGSVAKGHTPGVSKIS